MNVINSVRSYQVAILLCVIFIFALCIRLYNLASTPPLDLDEYGIYYNALSIAYEGIDEWGKSYPLFFQSFGDYKLAVDIYLAAILFKVFEPSAFWLRFPSVIFSVLYIPTVYALLRSLTGQAKWALLGAFFISILPTGIFYSHSIGASISASFPIFASLTLFIIGFQKKTAWKYILASSLFLTIAIYAYPLAWILAPLLILAFSYLLFKEKKAKLILFYAIFAIASIPILLQFFLGGSQVRLSNTSATAFDRGPFLEMQQMRQTAKNDLLSKVFHNKLSTSLYILSTNYLKHFNISYLALDKTEPKIQISPYPPLYIVLLPFYLYGIIVLIKKRKTPAYLLLLYFLLIAPLPSAITEGAVHPKRYLGSLGLESILVVLALREIQIHKKRLIFILLSLVLLFEISLFLRFFHGEYAVKSNQLFYAKARIIEKVAAEHWPKSPLFYTTESLGEPQIYPLVGARYPAQKYQQTRVAEFRDNWVFVTGAENLLYADTMDTLISQIEVNTQFPAYGVFSSADILSLPKTICYDSLNTEIVPLLKTTYYEIQLKKCTP